MNKRQLSRILALTMGLQSPAIIASDSIDLDALFNKIPTRIPVDVRLTDLDRIDGEKFAEAAGKVAKETMKEVAVGGMEAFSEVAASGDFGKHAEKGLKDFTQQGANAFKNAMNNDEIGNDLRDGLAGGAKQATGAFRDAMNDQDLIDNISGSTNAMTSRAGEVAEGTQKGLHDKFWPYVTKMKDDAVTSVLNWTTMYQIFGPYTVASIASLSAIYGATLGWKVLEKRMLNPKPAILLPGSKVGRWDRISRWRSGYQSPAMIFDEQVKDRLVEIEEKTKNIRDHIYNGKNATYDNLLLYGKPGTGKTLFAQILADKTNMDFLPVTAGSLLQSGVEGIKYVNELVDMANRSAYGTIIFVDEADALFVDRDSLDPSSDHYKVLNHILALTGNGSNKFMLIAATNHAYVMDEAMGRRFQDRILMPLPDTTTRTELFNLYIGTTLLNEKNNSAEFVTAAKALLTPKQLRIMVEQTDGLSHAEIKDTVYAMHKKAIATKTGIITITHINSAIKQAVEKHAALEADKQEREQHHKVNA